MHFCRALTGRHWAGSVFMRSSADSVPVIAIMRVTGVDRKHLVSTNSCSIYDPRTVTIPY